MAHAAKLASLDDKDCLDVMALPESKATLDPKVHVVYQACPVLLDQLEGPVLKAPRANEVSPASQAQSV